MRTDILLDDDFDLQEVQGDWVEGPGDLQHVESMVMFNKGDNRDFPTVGFGISKRLKQRVDEKQFLRQLEVELDSDGYSSARVIPGTNLTDFKIEI